jgi:hypothetical protein
MISLKSAEGNELSDYPVPFSKQKASARDPNTHSNSTSWKDDPEVAKVDPDVILQLLKEVEHLEKMNGVGDMTKGKLLELTISDLRTAVSGGTAEFDAARWSCLSPERQDELSKRLTGARDALLNGADTRASRPVNDTLPGDGVSNRSIIWLAIFGFIFAATLLSLIR